MGTVTIELERYAYPRVTAKLDIPALIVGDIAIHRRAFWGEGEAPSATDATAGGHWTATHAPSGLSVDSAVPLPRRSRKRADVAAWAKRWQEAVPEYFALAREDVAAANARFGRDAIYAAIQAAKP